MDVQPCDGCGRGPRIKGERFCFFCRKKLMQAMKSSGYLQPEPHFNKYRGADARENITDTKYGRP